MPKFTIITTLEKPTSLELHVKKDNNTNAELLLHGTVICTVPYRLSRESVIEIRESDIIKNLTTHGYKEVSVLSITTEDCIIIPKYGKFSRPILTEED